MRQPSKPNRLPVLVVVLLVAAALACSPRGSVAPTPGPTPLGGGTGRIVFASDRDGNWEIYVMNADGTGQVRLTNDPALEQHPAWQPRGR